MSGAVTDRPALHDALEFARSGDTLIVWKLDRLAWSMKQLIETVETLRLRGIGFRSLIEALDTTTAQGQLVFRMFGALAESERSLIRERTQAGRAAARRAGRTGPSTKVDRERLGSRMGIVGQSQYRRHPNRTPSRCFSSDTLSLHPCRTGCESSRCFEKGREPLNGSKCILACMFTAAYSCGRTFKTPENVISANVVTIFPRIEAISFSQRSHHRSGRSETSHFVS